jgi:3-hydroxybutyryl-CoA dehydrogenase
MTADDKRGVLGRLRPISSLDEASSAGIAIEAIVEDLDTKHELFRALEKRLAPMRCLLPARPPFRNENRRRLRKAGAGAGLHFFNPPPLMRLVEVIGGLRSHPALIEALVGFVKRLNKHPVVATDTPGFVVNHAGAHTGRRPCGSYQRDASPREVDLLMKGRPGFGWVHSNCSTSWAATLRTP